MPDVVALHAQAAPGRPAVVEGDHVLGYAAFNDEVNRLAHGLAGLGFGPGDRAVWCGPNSWQVLAFIAAARKVGLMAVPLAYRFTPDEMQYVIDNSQASLVVG